MAVQGSLARIDKVAREVFRTDQLVGKMSTVEEADEVSRGSSALTAGSAGDADEPVPSTPQWRSVLKATVRQISNGVIIGVLTAVGVFAATTYVDERRSDRESRDAREFTWRQSLQTDAEFPGAVLRGLNLNHVYASGVDLSGGDLVAVDLSGAALVGAQLDGADLTSAELSDVNLTYASVRGAVLRDANLSGAWLREADFRASDLAGADLSGADLWKTDVRGVDLSTTVLPDHGLDRLCWDEATRFPDEIGEPATSVCAAAGDPEGGGLAEHWALDLVVGPVPEDGKRIYPQDVIEVLPGTDVVRLVLRFDNLGRAPINDLAVVFDIPTDSATVPASFVPGSVRLFTSNLPDGYAFPADAVQNKRRQVNINVGSYGAESNLYVEADLALDWSTPLASCQGEVNVTAFATPQSRGALSDSIRVTIRRPEPCLAEANP